MPDHLDMEAILANSFKDYHVKGFDYVCLQRAQAVTLKLYFFDGDVSKLPEVVAPHDHRYDFITTCVVGGVENRTYARDYADLGKVYQEFEYRTPLNGGNGFTWKGEQRLVRMSTRNAFQGASYGMAYDELHTIKIKANETCLMLRQYGDLLQYDQASTTFTLDREPPSLSGLYERFTADEVMKRLTWLMEKVPGFQIPGYL